MMFESYYSGNSSIVQDYEGANPNPNPMYIKLSERGEHVITYIYDVFMRPITFPLNFVCNGVELQLYFSLSIPYPDFHVPDVLGLNERFRTLIYDAFMCPITFHSNSYV